MATRPKAVIESRNGEKFSPITIAKNVLTDDGQNLHDILSDRKEDMMTPTIENSSSMFKVGQGDNVDYNENVVDGAYESLVFKGKSLVNLGREIDSQYHNISGEGTQITSDGYFKIPYAGSENSNSVRLKFGLLEPLIKPDTVYSLIVEIAENTTQNARIGFTGHNNLSCVEPVDTNTNIASAVGTHVKLIKRRSEVTARQSDLYFCIWDKTNVDVTKHIKFRYMILEGDWTNKELPPFFEGICDCKSPILTNVGKNLFDSLDSTMKSSWWIIVENGVANVKKEDLSTNYSVIIPAQSNTKYKVSGNNFTRAFYAFLDKDYNVLHADELVQRTTKSLSPQGTAYALFYLNHEDIEKVTNLQIEEGSTETPYEPYKSNTTTFKQKDGKMIVLRSLPNGVCDTLNVETGEYVQRIGEVVLDGSENWAFYGATGEGVTTAFKLSLTGHISAWMSGNGYCDRLKFVSGDYIYNTNNEGITTDAYNFVIRVLNEKASTIEEFKSYLKTKSLTVQYELATPIVKTVDLSGFPYAYTNGHVQLSSGHSGQSLTPKVEYSVITNRNGQIRSNQKMVERHQKQLDRLQAMILTNLVNTQYEQTLTNLKYDLKNVREEVK